MVFHDDIYTRANSFTNGGYTRLDNLHNLRRQQARAIFSGIDISILWRIGEEVDLDGIIALSHSFLGYLTVIVQSGHDFGMVAPPKLELAGVGTQIVPALAAQQLVNGHVECLALDVPQGDVQGGDACKDNRTTILPPEGGLVELVPDDLAVQRVHADNQCRQIPNHASGCGRSNAIG